MSWFNKNKNISNQTYKTGASVNFNKINVFAITKTSEGVTELGLIHNNRLECWYLRCSEEEHNKLINEFNKWKENK